MQCPHHSSRLCPAHRSHPRPDHQPCPPLSPYESHPRHRAAPPVFPRSAASCGAESFQHAGRKARTASRRAPRESYLFPSTVLSRGTLRRPSARPPQLPPRRANGLCRVPRPRRPNAWRCALIAQFAPSLRQRLRHFHAAASHRPPNPGTNHADAPRSSCFVLHTARQIRVRQLDSLGGEERLSRRRRSVIERSLPRGLERRVRD